MAENDTSWMDNYLNPTGGEFSRFIRGQERQFNPIIRTLRRQYRGMRPGEDALVKAFDDLISRQRTSEEVSGRFGETRANIARMISESPLGAAGARTSALLSAIGGAMGVDATEAGLVAEGAKTPAVDATRLAFQTGAESRLAGAEQEALTGLEQRMQELMLGRGEAFSGAKSRQQELGRMLAEARGQRMGARMNPLELAQMIGSFQDWKKSRRGGYGGGFSYGSEENDNDSSDTDMPVFNPWGQTTSGAPLWTQMPGTPGGSGGAYNISPLIDFVINTRPNGGRGRR